MYWGQGWLNAPDLVLRCRHSWEQQNSDYKVIALDSDSLSEYIKESSLIELNRADISIATLSDIIRLELLLKYGGVWTDATVMCSKPLSQWLPDYYSSGFFAFRNPGSDRLSSNWFLASEADNIILKKLHKEFTAFLAMNYFANQNNRLGRVYRTIGKIIWSSNVGSTRCWFSKLVTKKLKIYPYYIFHYTFNKIISDDKGCKIAWESAKAFEADLPHRLQKISTKSVNIQKSEDFILSKKSPMHKLNWRIDTSDKYWQGVFSAFEQVNNSYKGKAC